MSLWSAFTKRRALSPKRLRRLGLEPLEQRRVMSVSMLQVGTVLNITGDARSDNVNLWEIRSNASSPIADYLQVTWKDDLGKGGAGIYYAPSLSKIVFHGNSGHDTFRNVYNPNGAATFPNPYFTPTMPVLVSMVPMIEAHGGAGNDKLWGGPKADLLFGDADQDELYGGENNDKLYGGSGYDKLYGNYGHDQLYGGADGDYLYGHHGDDLLDGGTGNDVLSGGLNNDRYDFNNVSVGGGSLGFDTVSEMPDAGTDTLYFYGAMNRGINVDLGTMASQNVNEFLTLKLSCNAAIEKVIGTFYDDTIRGNLLSNYLYGNGGSDTIYGMAGNDTIYGGDGNDSLYAGDGYDTLYGGAGNDGLCAGSGFNTLYGQDGADRFLVRPYVYIDSIYDSQDVYFDTVKDATAADAAIYFQADGKEWTIAEIERVDRAFAILHAATNNTKLLKQASGASMTFSRTGGYAAGWNTGGNIHLTDLVMNGDWLWETGYALHEIGHNWDNQASQNESPIEAKFLALSGWTQTDPEDSAYTKISKYGETWWYKTNSAFASKFYAKTHPVDDFAESFAAYFLDEAGLRWYSNDGVGASDIPDKIDLIDSWVNTLRT